METEVISLVFEITDIATFTMHAISDVVRMTAQECFDQALAINSDATSTLFMICVPEIIPTTPPAI